jgi:hypothetical protein
VVRTAEWSPSAVVATPSGRLLVGCLWTHALWAVDPVTGEAERVAGGGDGAVAVGMDGAYADGPALTVARFNRPISLALLCTRKRRAERRAERDRPSAASPSAADIPRAVGPVGADTKSTAPTATATATASATAAVGTASAVLSAAGPSAAGLSVVPVPCAVPCALPFPFPTLRSYDCTLFISDLGNNCVRRMALPQWLCTEPADGTDVTAAVMAADALGWGGAYRAVVDLIAQYAVRRRFRHFPASDGGE